MTVSALSAAPPRLAAFAQGGTLPGNVVREEGAAESRMKAMQMTARTVSANNDFLGKRVSFFIGTVEHYRASSSASPGGASDCVQPGLGLGEAVAHGLNERLDADGFVEDAGEFVRIEIRGHVAGDENHRDVLHRSVRVEAALDGAAVEARHHEVEDDRVDGAAFDVLQRLYAVFGSHHRVSLERQHFLVQLAERGIVIDDQDSGGATVCGGHDRSLDKSAWR